MLIAMVMLRLSMRLRSVVRPEAKAIMLYIADRAIGHNRKAKRLPHRRHTIERPEKTPEGGGPQYKRDVRFLAAKIGDWIASGL